MTTSTDTERLIGQLTDEARPVRVLAAPQVEAAVTVTAILALAAAIVWRFARMDLFAERAEASTMFAAFAGALLTGILAVVAAFMRARPDRAAAWALLPLPGLALWLSASGIGCVEADGPGLIEPSMHCLRFILMSGLPTGIMLLLILRRARPIDPGPVAILAGLGAAGLSAALLQFFHPFNVTIMDLTIHMVAVLIVVGSVRVSRLVGRA